MARKRRTKPKGTASAASKPRPTKTPARAAAERPAPPAGGELLEMDAAIALLKTTRSTFYRWLRAGQIRGMKVGRQWRFERSEIDRFLKGEEPQIELRADIGPLLDTLNGRAKAERARPVALPEANNVQKAVKRLIEVALAMRATDFHVEPNVTEVGGQRLGTLRCRVDGVLHLIAEFDHRLLSALVEQLKRMSACDPDEKARPQCGRSEFGFASDGGSVVLMLSTMPTALGESAAVRVLVPAEPLKLDELNFSSGNMDRLVRAIESPSGLIAVTGPAGCGKTSTIYASLRHLAGPKRKIMTIESPVEFHFPWMLQAQVNEAAGVTYFTAARQIMRSAPNVIFIAEARNTQVLEFAHMAARTGHLVITTLHTDDGVRTLLRFREMQVDPFLIADALRLVVSQRLVRKLCADCSRPAAPAAHLLAEARELAQAGGLDWDSLAENFHKPVGCKRCHQTGYRGRVPIVETLEMTDAIREALRRDASGADLRAAAVATGMTTMAADGIRRAAASQTTLEEVFAALPPAQ